MRALIRARAGWTLALALGLAAGAQAQNQFDAPPQDPDPEAAAEHEAGFPWLCFLTTVAALGGLFVFVRKREREVRGDRPTTPELGSVWYCRTCDRDVSGRECPYCRAPNVFLTDAK
ncbi:MAG: hypothetical protein J2P46_02785 [Zavarzinella sp.]|nr:hypothetical protein [Zavarzinella sp.]